MSDPTPIQIKQEVKKELAKKDLSWLRKDWVIVGVLFTLLGVLNLTSVIAAKDAEKAANHLTEIVEQTDDIVALQTYLQSLMENTALCTLLTSGAVNTGQIEFEAQAMETFYAKCVDDRTTPPPS